MDVFVFRLFLCQYSGSFASCQCPGVWTRFAPPMCTCCAACVVLFPVGGVRAWGWACDIWSKVTVSSCPVVVGRRLRCACALPAWFASLICEVRLFWQPGSNCRSRSGGARYGGVACLVLVLFLITIVFVIVLHVRGLALSADSFGGCRHVSACPREMIFYGRVLFRRRSAIGLSSIKCI